MLDRLLVKVQKGVAGEFIQKGFKGQMYLRDFLTRKIFLLEEALTGYGVEKRKFKQATGFNLNLQNPQSFSEKIIWKKLYDRNPLIQIVSDKYKVRAYLKDMLGPDKAEEIFIPLLYVTDKPETIPFDTLPKEYIIKPNHGAGGKCIVVTADSQINRRLIISKCKRWLARHHKVRAHNWAYDNIKRKILIEKLLRDEKGDIPDDYKFFIFHGKCRLIQVIRDRFNDRSLAMYTPEWRYLDVKGTSRQAKPQPAPLKLKEMIQISETLGAHFDAIRVDLYSLGSRIYFGELTSYHHAGRIRWSPSSYDFELGKYWEINQGYWKNDPYIMNLGSKSFFDG